MQRILRMLPFWLALAFTLFMALTPNPPAVPEMPGDKVQHMLAFAALTVLAVVAWPSARLFVLFAWLSGLGLVIEGLQAIPVLHRDPALSDGLADSAAILGMLVLCAAWRWAARRGAASVLANDGDSGGSE